MLIVFGIYATPLMLIPALFFVYKGLISIGTNSLEVTNKMIIVRNINSNQKEIPIDDVKGLRIMDKYLEIMNKKESIVVFIEGEEALWLKRRIEFFLINEIK